MASDNLEAVRTIYAHWSEGDFEADAVRLDPLVLFVMGEGLPDTGTYLGVERPRGVHARLPRAVGSPHYRC